MRLARGTRCDLEVLSSELLGSMFPLKAHHLKPLLHILLVELGQVRRVIRHNTPNLRYHQIGNFMRLLSQNASFRIIHRVAHDPVDGRLRFRQSPPVSQESHHAIVLSASLGRHDSQLLCYKRATQHPVAYTDSMRDRPISVRLLHGMRECVSILKDHALQVLGGIHTKNVHFRSHTQSGQLYQILVIQSQGFRLSPSAFIQDVLRKCLHETPRMISSKQRCILAQLAKTAQQLVLGQSSAECQVHQNQCWCIIDPNVVLPAPVADRRFQRCGHVMHSQQSCRHVHQPKSTVHNPRKQASDVHQGAATKTHYHRAPSTTPLE
mmetsp:Transcript_54138/g.116236  ORF Transcript_54138/g.116236 Transcript_54138/m.116236 type:complete len:322 (-) Transcript_54138:108-1073(-)